MTRSIQAAAFVAAVIFSFCLFSQVQAAVPDRLTYQGYLTDAAGSPIDGEILFRFKIYNVETGGSPLWAVDQILPVEQGLFTAELGGPHTPFAPPFAPPDLFSQPLWLGIEADFDGEMLPRRPLTTVGFSFRAEDADAVQGHTAAELDQSWHVTDTANPHAVTAGQAGAVTTGAFSSHAANESAHHVKTTNFSELSGQVPWSELSGIPAGFADGIDHDSGGDITGVSAGYGLDGGGAAGSVALALENPLALSGDLLLGTGNLGIGLTDPNRRLYLVNRVPGMDYALKLDNPEGGIGTTGVGILFATEGSGGGPIAPTRGKGGLAYVSTGTWNRGAFHFLQDSGANANNPDIDDAVMTIANNGNVGVGTTTPASALDVRRNGSAYVTVDGGASGLSGYRIDENDQSRWLLFFRTWQSDNLIVRDEAGARDTMTFESGTGRVGIGTNAPQATLDVAGDIKVAGNIDMTGNVTWPARRSYYSLTAAAFVPENSDYNYRTGTSLRWDGWGGPVRPLYLFYAPVNLPHGATVKKLIVYWTDNDPNNNCALQLQRSQHSGAGGGAMATTGTSGSEPGVRLTYTTEITDPVIDNDHNAYFILLYHYTNWGDDVIFHSARIEYETTSN